MDKHLAKPFKGMFTDSDPSTQPEGTYRYAMNAVNETHEGDQASLSNEGSAKACTNIPIGFSILGNEYIGNNENVLILFNPKSMVEEIGILGKDNIYRTLITTQSLGLNINHQVDITYRLRRGKERFIYWVDGLNRVRSLNLDRLHNYYTQSYKNYLNVGGDPDTYAGEKWDTASFDLIKSYTKIPYFSDMEVLNYGNIKPGSINFAIQYVDEDLNPSEWINVSNTVNIYNSSLDSAYETIRGSYNANEYQVFPEASKSVKLTLANMDESFPYYRIAIIQATAGTGKINKVLVTEPQSTNIGTFTYSGNDDALAAIDVNEIRFDKESILKAQHIEQLENRLILANTEGNEYNWCEFQKNASAINTDLTTRGVILNSLKSDTNVKNEKSTFYFKGYMPGEVYSFGIMYIMKDNSYSPVYHIPGKSVDNTGSTMSVYKSEYPYPDIHNCIGEDYWGRDFMGNSLIGENVRHHKFPTRQEAGKPLVTTTESPIPLMRYVLKMIITLKTGEVYPTDVSDNPIIINYQANYQLTGGSPSYVLGTMTKNKLGKEIDILDIVLIPPNEVLQAYPPDYTNLDPASQIVTEYMSGASDIFDVEYIYRSNVDDTINEVDQSEIFGIEFSNITKPHPDVIGFFIVRNEVFDSDKIIVDNCIVGPNVKEKDYRAFTHITPAFPTSRLDDESVWFFSPEVQFNGKQLQFNDIDVQGAFKTTSIIRPNIIEGKALGVYVEDVQAGSSYNPEVNKKSGKDSDGFSLQVAYKTSIFAYEHIPYTLGRVKNSFALNPATNKLLDSNNYYNVSVDNKIGMTNFIGSFDNTVFKTGIDYNLQWIVVSEGGSVVFGPITVKGSRLLYASLRRGRYNSDNIWEDTSNSYQDFLTRSYYKEHMQPVYFELDAVINNHSVFNGDVEISSLDFLTTLFRQLRLEIRPRKSTWWMYLAGAVLLVVGIFFAWTGVGTAVAAVGAALVAGAFFIANAGLAIDKALAMFQEEYDKGLFECVEDAVVENFLLPMQDDEVTSDPILLGDDAIQWFVDRASRLYIESRVPFGLRAGTSAESTTDFMDSPAPYSESILRNYIIEKMTVFDRDQGGGRLYRGVPVPELYSMNPDYSRFNKEKAYVHLPSSYDCCTEDSNLEKFPMRVWYSQQSFQEEKIDNYRAFLVNNYRDIEGEKGEITDLYKIGNSLFIHTEEALWKLPQNIQEKVTNELTTYVGTGDFFNIKPEKVVDDNLGSGGSSHKWATLKTKVGIFFISEIENKVYLHSEGLNDISINGMKGWFEEYLKPNLIQEVFDKFGVEYRYKNNPASSSGLGYISTYDTRFERILFTKKDWSIVGEMETINSATTDLTPLLEPYLYSKAVFNLYYNQFWKVDVHEGGYTRKRGLVTRFEDFPEQFENKSFTISYSLNTKAWASFHSYIPNYYINNQIDFFSFIGGDNNIYKHNTLGDYQEFYEKPYPHYIEFVSNSSPIITRTWEDISFNTIAKRWDTSLKSYVEERYITFNEIRLSNSRQCSGDLTIIPKDTYNLADYLGNQTINVAGSILADKNEKEWNINSLRDYVIDYTQPMYSRAWSDIRSEYPIDKVVNPTVISYFKDWQDLESFRDKYLIIRLKFDNFANIKLTTQFTTQTENKTIS